jgi:hypothetical protein
MIDLSDVIQGRIETAIDRSQLSNYIPLAEVSGDPGELLYSSDRDYMEQLRTYNSRKSGGM